MSAGLVNLFKNQIVPTLYGDVFGDVVRRITYRVVTQTRDNSTGRVTNTNTDYTNKRAKKRAYTREEINNVVLPGDVEFSVEVKDLGVVPEPNGRVLDSDSVEYNVVRVGEVPAGNPVLYKLHCRTAK